MPMSGNAQITEGQKLEIGGIFVRRLDDILRGMPQDVAQNYIGTSGGADKFVEDVRRGIFPATAIDFSPWLSKWEKFYKKIFGRKYDFSGIPFPPADDVFTWTLCMAGDIPAEDWLSAGKNPFPFWKYTGKKLDEVLDLSFGRDGWNHQYIARLKANEEADEDLKDISAIKIAEMKINTATLRERLAIGRFLYWDRGLILDKKYITLCAGSRYSDGYVPFVSWFESHGRVVVDWDRPGDANDFLRSRRAVS